jgi:hypothetical protein
MISLFYAYVEHIEIKTKTVNIIHFPYLDLSQNVKIRDVPYSLKSNFERHHNNLSSVNYLMTTVKIERAFIHLRSHIYLYIIHMT